MTLPKAAELSMFMSVPPLSRKKVIVSCLPSYLSPFSPFYAKCQTFFFFFNLEILFHITAERVSWDSSNKNVVILEFSRNLGNLFVKYTAKVVKLDVS